MARIINTAGWELIRKWEGCILHPYKDLGGIWTIGFGHTKGVTAESTPLTQDQADALLLSDLEPFEQAVDEDVLVVLTDNQFSALVSLCYNVGTKPLHGTLGDYLNDSQYEKAADAFLAWDHVAGIVSAGLLNRRKEERELFLT